MKMTLPLDAQGRFKHPRWMNVDVRTQKDRGRLVISISVKKWHPGFWWWFFKTFCGRLWANLRSEGKGRDE